MLILIFIIILLVVVFLLFSKAKKQATHSECWPYYAKKPLSKPELVLYFRLCNALPNHIVLAQVGLSRILGVKKGHNFGQWFNRINRMSADFVIGNKDASIALVIELDDASHQKPEREQADQKKNKALADAGIHLLRWHVRDMPTEQQIKDRLQDLL